MPKRNRIRNKEKKRTFEQDTGSGTP